EQILGRPDADDAGDHQGHQAAPDADAQLIQVLADCHAHRVGIIVVRLGSRFHRADGSQPRAREGALSGTTGAYCGPDGRLAGDVFCSACGHNLRGLLPDGQCVECGLPVGWSRRGGGFLSANSEWLESLRGGIASLALLLPWMWMPLTWPFVA